MGCPLGIWAPNSHGPNVYWPFAVRKRRENRSAVATDSATVHRSCTAQAVLSDNYSETNFVNYVCVTFLCKRCPSYTDYYYYCWIYAPATNFVNLSIFLWIVTSVFPRGKIQLLKLLCFITQTVTTIDGFISRAINFCATHSCRR